MKIYGNGIDITMVSRIEKLCENSGFATRFFTENELSYATQFKNKHERLAGFFCAKEAFSKAYGTGIRSFALKDIEVTHDNLGKPSFVFYNQLDEDIIAQKLDFFLSISHCSDYAVANVIATKL